MKHTTVGATLSLLLVAVPSAVNAAENVFEDIIIVTSKRDTSTVETLYASDAPAGGPDIAGTIARLPGAGLVNNGALSGQVQYRGAYGYRIGAKVNGQSIASGGPNLMDPPMHYAPPTLVDTIAVHRGAAPVSFGPSLIGGVNANLKQINFGDSSSLQPAWDLSLIGRSADNSHAAGLIAGVASSTQRFYGYVSDEGGDNRETPIGELSSTFHDRQVAGVGVGIRSDTTEWDFQIRRQETGPTGNPPFAMDINFVDTDFAKLSMKSELGSTQLIAKVSYMDVDHLMDNHTSRPPPTNPMMFRANRATAETLSVSIDLVTSFDQGDLSWGADFETSSHNARISNPNNVNFYLGALPDIEQDRTGAYLSWAQAFGEGDIDVGVRADYRKDQAGDATTGPALPMGPTMLAQLTNENAKSWNDTTVDLLARYWRETDVGTWRVSVARKNRAPTYLERYGWMPIPASAGLADGNTYVGDLNLAVETAWIVETGLDVAMGSAWLRPSIYYHDVDDYIQGVPFDNTPGVTDSMVEMISTMNGDPTPLRFANVDARMYGFDADYGIQLSQHWRVEGVLSLVRGDRRDIDDGLYRITPDRFSAAVVYDGQSWTASVEAVGIRRQSRVSISNSELETPGYGLLNAMASWRVSPGLTVTGGIDNISDRLYTDHLAGYNRVMNSAVAVGTRLPGTGRNIYLRLAWHSL